MRDLNDLHFFAAVVANGGFSAAARAIGVPKSRISRRVAALEAELGVRLLERSTRRFSVTEVGQEVYRHARAAVSEAEEIANAAARIKTEPQGLVRISCPQDAVRLLGAALPPFLARHPKLRVQLLVGNRRVNLIDEGVDVAVRIREKLDSDAELQVKMVGRARALLVASPGFLEAHGRPANPAALADAPTLALTDRPGPDRWRLVNAAGGEAIVEHEPRLSATTFAPLVQAALADLGVAFAPDYACNEHIEAGRLERVLPDWSWPEGILHIVFTSRRGLLPSVRAVIDFAAEALNPGSPVWRTAV